MHVQHGPALACRWQQGDTGSMAGGQIARVAPSSLTLPDPASMTWGWGGLGAGSVLGSRSVFVKYCVLHKLAERRGRVEGNESALSTQLQNKYKTP